MPRCGANAAEWRFFRFGLIATGETEEQCLPDLFRILASQGNCSFTVIRRIGQRSPIRSARRKQTMVGTVKRIPDRDAEQIGIPARRFLSSTGDFVLLVDDLEASRSGEADGWALASARRVEGLGVVALSASGGRIEPGESAEACAIREVAEEVGIRVQALALRALLRYHDPTEGLAMTGVAFVSSDFRGAHARTAEADPFWCRIDEIPYDEMRENDRIWLPRVLRGEGIRPDFPVCRGRLITHTVIPDADICV